MIGRRRFVALVALTAFSASRASADGAADGGPAATVRGFYDVLLSAMKDARRLGFAGRRDRLAPAIRQAYDFPLMTRLMVGPLWQGLEPAQRQALIDAFSGFSIATYANRFDDYSGERFDVDPAPKPLENGDAIVQSRMVQSDGEKVELDYLMRNDGGRWQIIDVYLSGTVSELATRRAEFSSVMRRGGAEALVQLLEKKARELAG